MKYSFTLSTKLQRKGSFSPFINVLAISIGEYDAKLITMNPANRTTPAIIARLILGGRSNATQKSENTMGIVNFSPTAKPKQNAAANRKFDRACSCASASRKRKYVPKSHQNNEATSETKKWLWVT